MSLDQLKGIENSQSVENFVKKEKKSIFSIKVFLFFNSEFLNEIHTIGDIKKVHSCFENVSA